MNLLNTQKWLVLATFGMMGAVAVSNYLVEFPINEWLTWGAFSYPFTFLITELVNRFYGPKQARRIVYIGFIFAMGLGLGLMNRRVAFASGFAFLLGQLLDISIFNRLRRGQWWLGPAVASISASLLDTMIFFSVAFVGTPVAWVALAFGDGIAKIGMDFCFLVPFRMVLWRAKQN